MRDATKNSTISLHFSSDEVTRHIQISIRSQHRCNLVSENYEINLTMSAAIIHQSLADRYNFDVISNMWVVKSIC